MVEGQASSASFIFCDTIAKLALCHRMKRFPARRISSYQGIGVPGKQQKHGLRYESPCLVLIRAGARVNCDGLNPS